MKIFFVKHKSTILIETDIDFTIQIQKLLKQTIIHVKYKNLTTEFESPLSFEYIQARIKSFLEILEEKLENKSIIDVKQLILDILRYCKEGDKNNDES